MDQFTKAKRSEIMRSIKSTETIEETRLSKALWHSGLRFRKNNKNIFGKPDISIKKYKLAIFVDGEFFHGENWEQRQQSIGSNREYWIPKIERNIQRDKEVNEKLESDGWIVVRFWSKFVRKNLDVCVTTILDEIESRKHKLTN